MAALSYPPCSAHPPPFCCPLVLSLLTYPAYHMHCYPIPSHKYCYCYPISSHKYCCCFPISSHEYCCCYPIPSHALPPFICPSASMHCYTNLCTHTCTHITHAQGQTHTHTRRTYRHQHTHTTYVQAPTHTHTPLTQVIAQLAISDPELHALLTSGPPLDKGVCVCLCVCVICCQDVCVCVWPVAKMCACLCF